MKCCGGHCYLDHWLTIGFHFIGVLALVFLLTYAEITANFGFWSDLESAGLYTHILILSFFLPILTWVIVFFHNYRRKHYKQERLFVMNLLLCFLYVAGVCAAYLMLRDPTKAEIKGHLPQMVFGYKGDLLNSFQQLQEEKKCCGVDGYLDFCFGRTRAACGTKKMFPDTCCLKPKPNSKSGNCIVDVTDENDTVRLHQKGCMPKGKSDYMNTKTYRKIRLVKALAMIPLFFPLLTIIMVQLVILLSKPPSLLSHHSKSSDKKTNSSVRVVFRSLPSSNRQSGDDGGAGEAGVMPTDSSVVSMGVTNDAYD